MATCDCNTPPKIFSVDDPTLAAVFALDWVWEKVVLAGMDDGKTKPGIRSFRSVTNGGRVIQAFLRDGVIYVNDDVGTGADSIKLRQTILEEVAGYLTEDCTRDLQDWAFKLAVRVAMATEATNNG